MNVLFGIIKDIFTWNFDFFQEALKMRYLKIIGVFTLGSIFGLISISHILGYALKRWHQIITAIIIGFITGSLGIVWPWKLKIFKQDHGQMILDQNGNQIIENYERFMPNIYESSTWFAIFFIFFGIGLILAIDFYGRRKKIK